MASWFDIMTFVLTIALFIGAIVGVKFIAGQVSQTVTATKESLKGRGLTISDKGVSVRTSSRYSREDYLDATQRGFIKAMGASSFTTGDNADGQKQSKPVLSRHASNMSVASNSSGHSGSEEKKKHRFTLRSGKKA